MKYANEEFLKKIDALAGARRREIRHSASHYPTRGNVYYVSANGNDENDGLSPETAFATIGKINVLDLCEGDTVLFERGGLFRGRIAAKTPHVTYSAYGTGAKPVICGSPENGADEKLWTLAEGTKNVYRYAHKLHDVGGIVFNDGLLCGIKRTPRFVDGKFVTRSGEEFSLAKDLDKDLCFFMPICDEIWEGIPIICHEQNVGDLYLRCDSGNPGKFFGSIEFLERGNTIGVGADYVTVDNLCIKYCGTHSIGTGNRTGLTVRDTEIGWGGGCLQFYSKEGWPTRFGNGIEIYVGCKDFTVEHCYIYQIYDAGVTHQFKGGSAGTVKHENVLYKDNLIEYCIYNIEYFLEQDSNEEQVMKNVCMTGNILRFAGYGWGSYYSRAAHIKGWDHRNISENFVIENNILDRSRSMLIHCGVQDAKDLPTMKGNTYIHFTDGGEHTLGRFGERGGNTFRHVPERLEYTEKMIEETVKDEGAAVYETDIAPVCCGYWPSGMEF